MALFPWNLNNLAGGGAYRVLYAPIGATIPQKLSDVIATVSPYAPAGTGVTAWKDFGATNDALEYERDMDSEGFEIQQVQGNILEKITDITRSVSLSLAEISPENLSIIENSPSAVATVAAAAGYASSKAVDVGPIPSLTPYRFAFVSQRDIASGTVTEPGGATRGRLFGFVAYRATLAAESSSISIEKGELAAAEVQFNFFPETASPANGNTGRWLDEDAVTIA